VIGEPPLDAGAVHDTTARVLPGMADTPVGGPGTGRGVTAALGAEGGPSPATFVAKTVNVYEVPFVSPVTVHEVVAVVQLAPPGDAVTV
jgi:hypothetical protein